jgi:hypothetical protein
MSFPKLSTTLYGRLFTHGKTYFETTLSKYSYNEKFNLNYNHFTGKFKWTPVNYPNIYISNITIQNLKTNITYNEYIRIHSNQIIDYSFSTYKTDYKYKYDKSDYTDKVIPSELLENIVNYEVVDNRATYVIMK